MKTCKNCNTQIEDGAVFCHVCGTKTEQIVNNDGASPKKFHCPNCKSTNITITTESSIDGAVSSHGRHFSSTSFSNTHRNFWVCSDCGTKFRNIQSLEEEIAKKKNYPTIFTVLAIISGIISLYLLMNMLADPFSAFFFGTYFMILIILTIVGICGIFSWKKKLAAMRAELVYLKKNCFN